MRVEFLDLDEDEVENLTEHLEDRGFRIDEDYEVLYGAKWKMVGVRFLRQFREQVGVPLEILPCVDPK